MNAKDNEAIMTITVVVVQLLRLPVRMQGTYTEQNCFSQSYFKMVLLNY